MQTLYTRDVGIMRHRCSTSGRDRKSQQRENTRRQEGICNERRIRHHNDTENRTTRQEDEKNLEHDLKGDET